MSGLLTQANTIEMANSLIVLITGVLGLFGIVGTIGWRMLAKFDELKEFAKELRQDATEAIARSNSAHIRLDKHDGHFEELMKVTTKLVEAMNNGQQDVAQIRSEIREIRARIEREERKHNV